jgi:hypothetical protein
MTVGSVKTHFSAYLPGSVFSLARNLFSATKVLESFDGTVSAHQPSIRSDPCQDHDCLFKLPNDLGRQDAQPRSRS